MTSRSFIALVSAYLTIGGAVAADTSSTGIIPLKPAPAHRMTNGLLESVCRRLPIPCTPTTTKALVGSKSPRGPLYLIDASRPMFIALDANDPHNANRARQWDFSSYSHSHPPVADGSVPELLGIYPALYRVGSDKYAVAILSDFREMYSGGGAYFQIADFVILSKDKEPGVLSPDAKRDVAYPAVPFSCSKMVRACFSEREYKTSPHCHDESNGYLTIQLPSAGRPDAPWTFVWHQSEWPAHVRKNKADSFSSQFIVPAENKQGGPHALPDDIAFCGGPAS